jgi:ABC-type branched-subunit amino acid transport system substrate-binding protein
MKRTGTTMRRRAAAALGAILGACLLAACASSEGGGTSAVTVKIGLIGDFSGVMASSFGGIPSVVNAWAAAANASGGLNGEKVAVVTEDPQAARRRTTVLGCPTSRVATFRSSLPNRPQPPLRSRIRWSSQ